MRQLGLTEGADIEVKGQKIIIESVKGKEIGKYRPVLVLSSKEYTQQTGLLICSPISTSIRGGATEVPVKNLNKPSVVAPSLIQTLSWKDRSAKKYPLQIRV